MSDRTVYTEEQAALLDAQAEAYALSQRYAHACEELLEEGSLRDQLDERRRQLDATATSLERRIRENDLMPHDINVDREDMARLADRFREWLDAERHSRLRHALAERESDLVERLDALEHPAARAEIEQARQQALEMQRWLESDDSP